MARENKVPAGVRVARERTNKRTNETEGEKMARPEGGGEKRMEEEAALLRRRRLIRAQ